MKTGTFHVSDLTPFEQAQVNAQLFASKLLITSTLVDVLERADAERHLASANMSAEVVETFMTSVWLGPPTAKTPGRPQRTPAPKITDLSTTNVALGSHVVSGGTAGLGLLTARWLARLLTIEN